MTRDEFLNLLNRKEAREVSPIYLEFLLVDGRRVRVFYDDTASLYTFNGAFINSGTYDTMKAVLFD